MCPPIAYFISLDAFGQNRANINHTLPLSHTHAHAPSVLNPGPVVVVVVMTFLFSFLILFIKLYITKKKKTIVNPQPNPEDHPGVNGPLPRIGLSDDDQWLRVQGRIKGLRPVPASAAVKLVHRLDLEDRLPRLCTASGRARSPPSDHLLVLFPGRLRSRKLEAAELSVFPPSLPPPILSFLGTSALSVMNLNIA